MKTREEYAAELDRLLALKDRQLSEGTRQETLDTGMSLARATEQDEAPSEALCFPFLAGIVLAGSADQLLQFAAYCLKRIEALEQAQVTARDSVHKVYFSEQHAWRDYETAMVEAFK